MIREVTLVKGSVNVFDLRFIYVFEKNILLVPIPIPIPMLK